MATQTQTATAPEPEQTAAEKVQYLRELYADAPELSRTKVPGTCQAPWLYSVGFRAGAQPGCLARARHPGSLVEAIYGDGMGNYPMDPTIILRFKQPLSLPRGWTSNEVVAADRGNQ